ncbi:MAG: Uma2 family endonuclease [Geminicoccaceae bacterium]
MAQPVPSDDQVTVSEFLGRTWPGEWWHELVEGRVVAMNPPRAAHARLVSLVGSALERRLPPGCGVYVGGGAVRAGDDRNYRVPDLSVACGTVGQAWVDEPVLIIEILSPSTAKLDAGSKLAFYRSLPSVQEILLVASDRRHCELQQREGERWIIRDLIGSAVIELRSIGAAIPLDEIYTALEL